MRRQLTIFIILQQILQNQCNIFENIIFISQHASSAQNGLNIFSSIHKRNDSRNIIKR